MPSNIIIASPQYFFLSASHSFVSSGVLMFVFCPQTAAGWTTALKLDYSLISSVLQVHRLISHDLQGGRGEVNTWGVLQSTDGCAVFSLPIRWRCCAGVRFLGPAFLPAHFLASSPHTLYKLHLCPASFPAAILLFGKVSVIIQLQETLLSKVSDLPQPTESQGCIHSLLY